MTEAASPVGASYALTHTAAQFKLGTRSRGSDNTEWVYVQADGAIRQYDVCGVDEDYQCSSSSAAIGAAGWLPGFAQVAFADNEYGWVATKGSNIYAKAINVSADAQVVVGASGVSAGVMSASGGTGSTALMGVVCVTAAGSTASHNVEIIATSPYFDQ